MDNMHEKKKMFGFILEGNPDSTKMWPMAVVGAVIMIIVVLVVFIKFFIENNQPRINLLYAPLSAVATMDGKAVDIGEIVLSGKHEITVEKYGFESQTVEIEPGWGDATPVYIVLTPNMEETEDWYTTHEEDGRILEGINGYSYDAKVNDMIKQYPIIEQLPVIKQDYSFYQQACDEPTLCILVVAEEGYFGDAIDYFKKKLDSDVGKYRFIFSDYSNSFMGEG